MEKGKIIKSDDDKGFSLTEDQLDEINGASGEDMPKDDVVEAVKAIDAIAATIVDNADGEITGDDVLDAVEKVVGKDDEDDSKDEIEVDDGMIDSAVQIMVQQVPDGYVPDGHDESVEDTVIDDIPSTTYDSDDLIAPEIGEPIEDSKNEGVLVIGNSACKNGKFKKGSYKIKSSKNKKYMKQAYDKIQKLTSGKKMNKVLWALTSALACHYEKLAEVKSSNMKKVLSAYKKGVLKFQIDSAKACGQKPNVKKAGKKTVKSSKHLVHIMSNSKALKSAFANIVDCMSSEVWGDMDDLSSMLWGEGKKTFDEYIWHNADKCDALFEYLDEAYEHQEFNGDDCATLTINELNDLLWFNKQTLVDAGVLPNEVVESLKKAVKSGAEIDPDGTTKVVPEKVEGKEVGFNEVKKEDGGDELEGKEKNPEGSKPQTDQITKVEGNEEVASSVKLWASMYCRRNHLDQSLARGIASAVAVYTRENKGRIESSMSKALRDDYAAKERERLFQSSSKAEKEAMVAEKQQIVSNVNTMSSLMARMF